MDLRHFFDGQQSKENAASAWLATLLEFSLPFRAAFFADVDVSLNPSLTWTVGVETELDGPCDVTLETEKTFLFVENKIAASAKQEGQFLRYYLGAVAAHRAQRVIGVYLGPSADTGDDERLKVTTNSEFKSRAAAASPDVVIGMSWKGDLPRLVDAAVGQQAWFARSGLASILAHMQRLEAGRPPNEQREVLRRVVASARERLGRLSGGIRFARWPSVGQEALYTVKSPVTMFLTLNYDEDQGPPYELHGVVVDGLVSLRVGVSFGLSSSGRKIPVLVDAWRQLVDTGAAQVDGLGQVEIANRRTFAADRDFVGSAQDLEDLLVSKGQSILAFLAPYLALGTSSLRSGAMTE